MKRYLEAGVAGIALLVAFAYLVYLYLPLKEGEFSYFANLPATLSGLAFFSARRLRILPGHLRLRFQESGSHP